MSGVTNTLVSCASLATQRATDSTGTLLDEIFRRHLHVAQDLLSVGRLSHYLATLRSFHSDIDELLALFGKATTEQRPALVDRLLSYGEQLSSQLLALVLRESGLRANYVDAQRCIITTDTHGAATPLADQTAQRTKVELGPIIDAGCIPVLGGFIGATSDATPTTLGRNGSDYTASLIGAAVGAGEIQIWTDVAGVLTADPRIVDSPTTVERLSYSEAAELSYFGARVVYPQAIECAAKRQIPLRICSSYRPCDANTIVSAKTEGAPGIFKSITSKTGLILIRVNSFDSRSDLFASIEEYADRIELVEISGHSVSIVMQAEEAYPMIEALQRSGSVEIVRDRALVCVIGEGLSDSHGSVARILGAIADVKIDLISQGRCRSSVVFVVDEEESREIVVRLHLRFFEVVEVELLVAHSDIMSSNRDQLHGGRS